jgi:beta-mannosidase
MRIIELNQDWEFTKEGDASFPWLPAIVPGCVHLDLMRSGVIPDPFQRLNEAGVQWVDECDWTYRTTFEWEREEDEDELFPSELTMLEFDELDTICTIWLNGELIGDHDNYHAQFSHRVVPKKGTNTLEIRFESARVIGRGRMEQFEDEYRLKGKMENFYERSFVRKPQYMFGWDWGPKLAGCGIHKPGRLRLASDTDLIDPFVRIMEVDNDHAKLTIGGFLGGDYSDGMMDEDEDFTSSITIKNHKGEVVYEGTDPDFELENPDLWYPNGWGAQPIYTADVELKSGDELLSKKSMAFGLKSVKLLREADKHGESFEFEVNGRKIWCMGANWIPDHSFPVTITREQVFEKIRIAKDLGFNMIRVWGGGLYESEDFYDACDEMGILVWQDFAFGCAFVPDDQRALESADFEVFPHLNRFNSRACLAILCGNNENQTMFDSPWGPKEKQPGRYWGEKLFGKDIYDADGTRDMVDGLLSNASRAICPQIPYIPTSPTGKEGEANGNDFGDQHYWDVWHGRGDWIHYQDSRARFSSEYGFCSSPSMKVWRDTLGPDDWEFDSPAVKWHNKTGKPYDVYIGYIETHYPQIECLEDLFYYSQLNQRDAMRSAIEHYRSHEFCRGSLIWQLNDCWPVQSWSLVDCSGTYKAAAFELKRAYAHTIATILKRDDSFELYAAYDGPDSVDGTYKFEARCAESGKILEAWESDHIELGSLGRKHIKTINRSDLPEGSLVLTGSFAQCKRTVQMVDEPKETTFGDAAIEVRPNDLGVEVTCRDAAAIDLYFWDEDRTADFLDNFVTLFPGESINLRTSTRPGRVKARSLTGMLEVEEIE